ncbi:MAG: polysaccharide deacetylase, partial [Lachnospiraceae bacterium]|nr:polysaccharide deacetylase [Lachnospiraceae bacterium]
EYMEGDGFATRMIVGEDGKPTCEMILDDGSVAVGSYDLVPLLEDFIAEHPDFSYKGARAVIAFTGYQGILGYRTDPEYKDSNPNYEEDCQTAREVAQCLRDNGWELASHSWGHINMTDRDLASVKTDADKWEARVESLIGETDIILYPFGADIGDWRLYNTDNEKFNYLYKLGFRYFCNVDGSPHWVQIGDTFMRQGRRNLDGYRMYYDLPETNPEKTYLDDLFDVSTVFDSDRPTPVPKM